ncbi:MAG: ubiquinol-cytochrome c reductase iron-sulfur subunit [Bdellovibrionales bacterium]
MADNSCNTGLCGHAHHNEKKYPDGSTRRDFILLAAGGMGAVAVGSAVWPVIDSMNPAADVLALASTEVDLSAIKEGQAITVKWRGKPVFIRYRTAAEIEAAENIAPDDFKNLREKQTDAQRVKEGHKQWLVLVGVCTHLGCVPLGQKTTEARGEYGGWFCPCHGSHYDTAGRIRKGPAPQNLAVPEYEFLNDTRIKIG